MKRILISLMMVAATVITAAAQDFPDIFSAFAKQANQEFASFRDKANREYADFMRKSWEWFEENDPVSPPVWEVPVCLL